MLTNHAAPKARKSPKWHPNEIRMTGCLRCPCETGAPNHKTTFSLRSGAGRVDYKTDYIRAGRSWTTLDDALPKIGDSSAILTALDDPRQCAECSKTAGCRFDSCPTCPSGILNLWGLTASWPQPILRPLTPLDPNGSRALCARGPDWPLLKSIPGSLLVAPCFNRTAVI